MRTNKIDFSNPNVKLKINKFTIPEQESNVTTITLGNPSAVEIIEAIGEQLGQDKVLVTSKYKISSEGEILPDLLILTFEAKPTEDGPWYYQNGKFNEGDKPPQQSMSNSVKKKFTELEDFNTDTLNVLNIIKDKLEGYDNFIKNTVSVKDIVKYKMKF